MDANLQIVNKKKPRLFNLNPIIIFIVFLHLVLFAGFTYLFYALIVSKPTLGYDWKVFYYPGTRAWMHGERLYEFPKYLVSPWGAWCLVPFTLLGESLGYAVFGSVGLLVLGQSLIWQTSRRSAVPLVLLLSILNHQTLDMFTKGQMVEVILTIAGLVIAQWAQKKDNSWAVGLSLLFLTAKAPNALPAAIYIFCTAIFSSEDWLRKIFKVLLIPALGFGLSLLLHGFWPINFADSIRESPPGETVKVTVFSFFAVRHIPLLLRGGVVMTIAIISVLVFRKAKGLDRLFVVLVTTYALTPYVQNHGFVVLWAMVAPWLASRGKQGHRTLILVWIVSIGIMAWRLTGAIAFMSLGWFTALLFWVAVVFSTSRTTEYRGDVDEIRFRSFNGSAGN